MSRILILTHDGLFGRKLSNLVSNFGIEADPCQSLGEATLRLRDYHYSAVVIDLGEDAIDPTDAIGAVKAISPGISVIAITDRNRLELEKDIRKQGVFYYLVKPIDEREYAEAVNRALEYSSSYAGYGI